MNEMVEITDYIKDIHMDIVAPTSIWLTGTVIAWAGVGDITPSTHCKGDVWLRLLGKALRLACLL